MRFCKLQLFLLLFGTAAMLTAQTESELLEEALREQGVDVERMMQLYERIQQADGFSEAEGYRMLGEVYPEYSVLQAAEAKYDAALAGDDPALIAQLATQLAQQQTSGLRALRRGLEHLQSLPPSDTLRRARALLLLEKAYHLQGDDNWQEAEADLQAALEQLSPEPMTDPLDWLDPELALELLLARYRAPLPDAPDAAILEARLDGLEHSLQLLHHLRLQYEKETDRLALAAAVPPLAYRAIVITLQLELQQEGRADHWRARAFTLSEQAKATLLADRLQGLRPNRQSADWPPLDQHLRLARQLKLAGGDFFQEPARLRRMVEDQLPELTSWPLPPQRNIPVEQTQRQLRDQGAIMISYFLTGEQCIVFTLDGESIQTDYIDWLPSYAGALDDLRTELTGRRFMRSPDEAYASFTEATFLLYETLVQRPALRHLSQSPQQLIFLPDAALWDIPFGVLLTEAAGKTSPNYRPDHLQYLAFRYPISYSPSAWIWSLRQSEVIRPGHSELAAFAPSFNGREMAERTLCGGPLPHLAHSREEAEAVLTHLPGQVFLGELATREAFLQAGQNKAILHLATHACRDEQNPGQSAIYFQDGALTAGQIAAMPISSYLTVLSACETQSGDYRPGEGVLSIGRAFLHAGSRSLIGSLWPVSDAATAELIPYFYEGLSQGMPTGEALSWAQREFLLRQDRLTAHPHYWAGFVLLGQSETLAGAGGNRDRMWLLLGVAAFFLIFAGLKRARSMRKSLSTALLIALGCCALSAQPIRIAVNDFQTGGRLSGFKDIVFSNNTDEDYRQVQQDVMEVFLENDRFVLLDRSQLGSLQEERELQRHEDFMEGYIVEQFSAEGGDFLLNGNIHRGNRELTLSVFQLSNQSLMGQHTISLKTGWFGNSTDMRRLIQSGTREFIGRYFPLEMPVIKVLKGNNRAREILVAGGQNNGLREEQTLSIKVEEMEMVNGEQLPRLITLGRVEVEDVENEHFSRCRVLSGGREIFEYLEQNRSLTAVAEF